MKTVSPALSPIKDSITNCAALLPQRRGVKSLAPNANLFRWHRIILTILTSLTVLSGQKGLASMLFSDGFNYTAGTQLGGNGPWKTNTAGTGVTIGSTNLTYTSGATLLDFSPAGNDVNSVSSSTSAKYYAPLTTTANSGTVYSSFLIQITATANSAGILLVGLLNTSMTGPSAGSVNDAFDIVGASNATTVFYLYAAGSGSSHSAAFDLGPVNTVHLVVVKYNIGTGVASLFLDPIPGGSEPGSDVNQSCKSLSNLGWSKSRNSYLVKTSGISCSNLCTIARRRSACASGIRSGRCSITSM